MSAQFKQAIEDVKKLKTKPSNDQQLELYSLFKIGNGETLDPKKKPGMFDMVGKAKWGAWEKEVNAGTTEGQAQTRYVELVEKLKSEIGWNP